MKVDLHLHTHFSPDSLAPIHKVMERARALGFDRIAITDHNCILGAQIAWERDPDFIIPGEEVRTDVGEVIAYYVKEEVPKGLPLLKTLDLLEEQGAVISIPHPVDRLRSSALGLQHTLEIVERVDAVEVLNSRCMFPGDNRRALALAQRHGKAVTAGSDAHMPMEIGHCGVHLPAFDNHADAFRAVLKKATPFGAVGPWWAHFGSRYAKIRKQLLPYDAGSSEPIGRR